MFCGYCGADFAPLTKRRVYCSATCRVHAHRLRNGLPANPFGEAKTDGPELVYLISKAEYILNKLENGNAICERAIQLYKLGHHKAIWQSDKDYITRKSNERL